MLTILIITYCLAGLVTARRAFRNFVENEIRSSFASRLDWVGDSLGHEIRSSFASRLDWVDVSLGLGVGLIALLLWPVFAAVRALGGAMKVKDAQDFALKLGGETRESKLARREQQVREREARIAQLEREAGIS